MNYREVAVTDVGDPVHEQGVTVDQEMLTECVGIIGASPRMQKSANSRALTTARETHRALVKGEVQTPLNQLLQGNEKGKTPVNWTPEDIKTFDALPLYVLA